MGSAGIDAGKEMFINLKTRRIDMKFKINYDEKNEILRAEIFDKFDAETGIKFFEELLSFSEDQQRYFLGNIYEPAQKLVDRETRRAIRERATNVTWERIAILGAKASLRMVVKIVLTAAGKGKQTEFFDTEEEAIAWLKAERQKAKQQASA